MGVGAEDDTYAAGSGEAVGFEGGRLAPDGVAQTESLFFHAGAAGVKRIVFSLTALPVEESAANNAMDRLVTVSGDKRRILYVEGEPRWDHKFFAEGRGGRSCLAGGVDAAHDG